MQVMRSTLALALVTAVQLFPLEAGGASLQDIVDRHGLAGTWAPDCTKPASRQNPHVVYRLVDAGRLQREITIAPGEIFDVSIAVSVVESNPDELIMVWETREGGMTNRVSVQPGQMQLMESTRDSGEKLTVNGRRTRDNSESPRYKRCRTAPSQAKLGL
jgi:hypothetical protein